MKRHSGNMGRYALIGGLVWVLALCLLFGTKNPARYHLREFENIKTNYNHYRPTIMDRVRGIRHSEDKWDYHLRSLEKLGVVRRRKFVFAEVPYTHEASKRIWTSAASNFPSVVMISARYLPTNAPGYGVLPYELEVWDYPSDMERWDVFFQSHNHRP